MRHDLQTMRDMAYRSIGMLQLGLGLLLEELAGEVVLFAVVARAAVGEEVGWDMISS